MRGAAAFLAAGFRAAGSGSGASTTPASSRSGSSTITSSSPSRAIALSHTDRTWAGTGARRSAGTVTTSSTASTSTPAGPAGKVDDHDLLPLGSARTRADAGGDVADRHDPAAQLDDTGHERDAGADRPGLHVTDHLLDARDRQRVALAPEGEDDDMHPSLHRQPARGPEPQVRNGTREA